MARGLGCGHLLGEVLFILSTAVALVQSLPQPSVPSFDKQRQELNLLYSIVGGFGVVT